MPTFFCFNTRADHYSKMKIQPAEFVNKNKMLFAEGNAIKYICRHINKGGLQDLEKAKHYMNNLFLIYTNSCRIIYIITII